MQLARTCSTSRSLRSIACRWGWMRMGVSRSRSSDSSIRELSRNSSLASSWRRRYVDFLTLETTDGDYESVALIGTINSHLILWGNLTRLIGQSSYKALMRRRPSEGDFPFRSVLDCGSKWHTVLMNVLQLQHSCNLLPWHLGSQSHHVFLLRLSLVFQGKLLHW